MGNTADFLAELYSSARNNIGVLHIQCQRTKPANLDSFRRLCGIMDSMPKLETLRMTIPINGRQFHGVPHELGLWNMPALYKDQVFREIKYNSEVVRGFGFSTNRRAKWVQHLLSVRDTRTAGREGFQDFGLIPYRPAEATGLITWLENKMTLEWEYRVAAVDMTLNESWWMDWLFWG